MKKILMANRFLTTILAICLLLYCLPTADAKPLPQPMPPTGSCGPNAVYELKDGVLTVSGTGSIVMHVWPNGVSSLVIEDGITAISEGRAPASLAKVSIPDSVTYICASFFDGTKWLKDQTDEFVIVGDHILVGYNGPGGAVTIPDTVRSICGALFISSDITAITVGSSVEHIGASAFAGCSKLKTVSIANTVLDIEGMILANTPWMRAQAEDFVIVGDHVLIAYKGPGGVVEVPDGVRAIAGGYTFQYRQDNDIFHERIYVTEITIPATVIKIAADAIQGGYFVDGVEKTAPVIVHGESGSAAERFCRENEYATNAFRFVPFGQEEDSGSLFNFIRILKYSYNPFDDVPSGQWYCADVKNAYEFGLIKGKGDHSFDPGGAIKLNEAVTVATRVRDIYYDEGADFSAAGLWYQPYVDYALKNGIIAEPFEDWERPATRAEFASMLAAALPEKELEAIRTDVSFADVENHPACDAIMLLARAGVMQGKGEGCFDPDAPVKRSEAASMLARCVLPEQRLRFEG